MSDYRAITYQQLRTIMPWCPDARAVNGGLNGQAERLAYFQRAKEVLA